MARSGDTGVRTYERAGNGARLLKHATPRELGLDRPAAIAFSPDQRRLAVGDRRDRTRRDRIRLKIAVVDTETLQPDGAPMSLEDGALDHPNHLDPRIAPASQQYALDKVAWINSPRGQILIGGGFGEWRAAAGRRCVRHTRQSNLSLGT